VYCFSKLYNVFFYNSKHSKKLVNKRETYLLIVTMEEAGELIRACSKVFRHGLKKSELRNLSEEAGDVQALINLLKEEGLIDPDVMHKKLEQRYNKHK